MEGMAGPALDWNDSAMVTAVALGISLMIYILIRILTHRHEDHGPPRNGRKAGRDPDEKRRPPARPK